MGGLRGRGRERDARHGGPALGQLGEGQVVGPEIVAPLRHAVRLVDREQRDLAAGEEALGALGRESLGRDVEQIEPAREVGLLHLGALRRILRGIEERGTHTHGLHGLDLVVHERDERRDDHTGSLSHERRHLVAQ